MGSNFMSHTTLGIIFLLLLLIAGPVSGAVITVNPSVTRDNFQILLNGTADDSTIVFNPGIYSVYDILVVRENLTFQSNESGGGTTQNTILDGTGSVNSILYNRSNPVSGGHINYITIKKLTLRNGFTTNSNGGGAISSYANTTIISSDFFNDTAPGKFGGAVNIHSNGQNLTVIGSNFTDCSAATGGAISNQQNIVYVKSSSFVNCSTTTGSGGAINTMYGGEVNFCRFGAITSSDGSFIVRQNPGTFDVTDNWWGTNTPAAGLVSPSSVTIYPYLVMGFTATPPSITTAQTSSIQANFSYDSTGAQPSGNILPDGIPVLFTIGSGPGSVLPGQSLTTSHLAGTTFSSATGGSSQIIASVDGQAVNAAFVNVSAVPPITTVPTTVPPTAVPIYGGGGGSGGGRSSSFTGPTSTVTASPLTVSTPVPRASTAIPTLAPVATVTAASTAIPQPSLFEKILQVIQANLIWLIIAIIIIVLIAILRRWWIRRQNPALFRKSD
jgi:hypothetical protein